MTQRGRMDWLERALKPEEPPFTFSPCEAPEGLTEEAHAAFHAAKGDPMCFTLYLGSRDLLDDA